MIVNENKHVLCYHNLFLRGKSGASTWAPQTDILKPNFSPFLGFVETWVIIFVHDAIISLTTSL